MGNSIINVVDSNNPGKNRRSVDLLPSVFRTDRNTKFLAGTLDQLIQPAKIEKIGGWVGSKNTPTYNPKTDFYIPEELPFRKKYQLEPGVIVKDKNLNITKAFGYDDLINQLAFNGARTNNLDRLFRPEFYSYDPHIDWDKFVNFDQYYWVPQSPDSIGLQGIAKQTISTYSVKDDSTGNYFILNPDGLTENPMLTLYRGVKYIFNVNSSHKFWIKTKRSEGTADAFNDTVSNNGASTGQIILEVDDNTPKKLYYVAEDTTIAGGEIIVKPIEENTVIDVTKEVIGKQHYVSNNGVSLSNGMKVHFLGETIPERYAEGEYIVEGVGDAIQLIRVEDLATPEIYTDYLNDNFDASPFDKYPFDNYLTLPIIPEYVTISRQSRDRNPWSRYNRWVHEDVLIATAKANKSAVELPQEYRAKRPIIEFKPNLQLANFGSQARVNADHIDTVTTDAFSMAEGQIGYYIDQILVEQGDRVIFAADEDPLVRDKVYQVEFLNNDGTFRLHFAEVDDSQVNDKDSVVVTKGATNAGTSWWYSTTTGQWTKAQHKTKLNQAPLFDVFDDNGISYSDKTYYNSDFIGTKVFGYSVGTGAKDPVLGFSLEYKNVADQGYYLFNNYFMTDTFINVVNEVSTTLNVNKGHLKFLAPQEKFVNVWTESKEYHIPIIQYQLVEEAVDTIEVTCINIPGYSSPTVEVFLNNKKLVNKVDYNLLGSREKLFVSFTSTLSVNDRVLFKVYSNQAPTETGYYETSIGYTNNPLNGPIGQFTLSELTEHARTMSERDPEFSGEFLGKNNIRDLANFNSYGTRLIVNKNPLSLASYFICDQEYDVIKSIRKVGLQYNQFKLSLLKAVTSLSRTYAPAEALDIVLHNINLTRDGQYPFAKSDMLAFGDNVITRNYEVTNARNKEYTIPNGEFNLETLSLRSVLVYHTDIDTSDTVQLLHNRDYTFDPYLGIVILNIDLKKGDTITVKDYANTDGCFVPLTPTKLGLYPKFEPKIFVDDTYAGGPQTVIQGHDGSITVAYGDIRDDVLLEFEKRVYNNIKCNYNPDLLDINTIIPGAYRDNPYSYTEVSNMLAKEFLKWAGFYGFDYQTNESFNSDSYKTWNWSTAKNYVQPRNLPGNWRGIFKYFYDTDRPHTHPWEMLGFSVEPLWWQEVYGPAPYTKGNLVLWQDLADGKIADPANTRINSLYARPKLLETIPVDDSGNLLDPASAGLALGVNPVAITDPWKVGDVGPVEAAWRRSSVYPFAVQILMGIARPAEYFSLMFDTSRMVKSKANQWVYSETGTFLKPADLVVYGDVLSAGYSAMLVEVGRQTSKNYSSNLKSNLESINLQLLHKVGGFVSKDKLDIIIDSVNPNSANPGVSLNNEDYEVFLNQGNPITVASISGLIVQKTSQGYVLKGYDKTYPYFTIYKPVYTATDPTITVGGKSEPYVEWTPSVTEVDRNVIGTAQSPVGSSFYQAGQIVSYNNGWYRVKTSHTAGSTFNSAYFQQIGKLPMIGGISVIKPRNFEKTETLVPYGTTFATEQEVYDVIMGYSKWLETAGFVFDEFQADLSQILDWNYASKEFLYWAIQGWAENSVITISPFANMLKFVNNNGVVDNILNRFYEYSLLKADGTILPSNKISMQRLDNEFVIKTLDTVDGIYFAQLNVVQKEHNLIFNNASYFNDIIYDKESGYRQRRIKLKGFRTAEWSGSLNSPGFIYDEAKISDWAEYTDYSVGDVVRFSGNYYSAIKNLNGSSSFDFSDWQVLGDKPAAQLLPNFDFKISQFEDFYSLDIDNFDVGQQKLAQHLVGYSPRTYLENIFTDQTTQYKFYQGFIKEKGTRNTISKLAKASTISLQTSIDFNEEWAFRTGAYGAYTTEESLELSLNENQFRENPQIINFVDQKPVESNDFIIYKTESDLLIKPEGYSSSPFKTVYLSELDTDSVLPTAGYVRLDDITATAYSKASLVDIANNRALNDGDTIFLGFREDGSWDVYRYTLMSQRVVDAVLNVPGVEITVTTDYSHNLAVGDLVSISQFGTEMNGVYSVKSVVDYNVFTVATTLNALTRPFVPGVGLLFKFNSARHSNLDDLSNNHLLDKYKYDEYVWVDDNGNNRWAVYQKTNAYESKSIANSDLGITLNGNQQFGGFVTVNEDADIVIVSSPNYTTPSYSGGQVTVYRKLNDDLAKVSLIKSDVQGSSVYFGQVVTSKYNQDTNTIDVICGAPGATSDRGLVKIVRIDLDDNSINVLATLTEPTPTAGNKFGSQVALSSDGTLYISAPGAGKVYSVSDYTNANVQLLGTGATSFGASLTVSGTTLAIGEPDVATVHIYKDGLLDSSITEEADTFGSTVLLSGDELFVAAPDAETVFVYRGIGFDFVQTLASPNPQQDVKFGNSMSISSGALVISSSGQGIDRSMSFDKSGKPNATTFDGKTTTFYNLAEQSGSVYVYNKFSSKYVLGQTLDGDQTVSNTVYGASVCAANGYVLVGAPGRTADTTQIGKVYIFTSTGTSWSVVRLEEPVVDTRLVNRVFTIDSKEEQVLDYLDIIDPIKGRIVGIADQELKFKTVFDPATYSIGITGTVNNANTNWLDEHLGELWWDLSAVKYLNYEQGDLEFRRNNWNRLFPGCSIDVYEWVRSSYLPSQWAALADTNEGLSQGISGQPKYPDNSVLSIKQVYNPVSNNFTNVYYFWVKNKITLPARDDRKLSAYEIANLIADPKAQGIKYASVIADNSLMLTNIKPTLNDNYVHLSVELEDLDSSINKHTEWTILRENDANSFLDSASPLLQKLIDSYLGRDKLGNPVPDLSLPDRMKYGVSYRPRQSMFKDRIGALRSLVEYTNTVFKNYLVNENDYNFDKLYLSEQPDNPADGQYDEVVIDNYAKSVVSTRYWTQAQINVNLKNGRVDSVDITNPGSGYGKLVGLSTDAFGNYITWKGPCVTLLGDGTGAHIDTIVDSVGSVIGVTITNKGKGYTYINPTVRKHAVVVSLDDTVNNRWSKYEWDYSTKTWSRVHTQSYDVTKYWSYVDWSTSDYVHNRTITKTINYTYQLPIINVQPGSYVRVNNPGDNKYIILRKLATANQPGTFNTEYDIIFKEKGTIQLSESLWNNSVTNYGFDSSASWDQTPFSQTNDTELGIIIKSLFEDILDGELKIYKNKVWFKSVKYALSEQKFLDWAFKTSFIYVKQNAGELDQRPTYKLQNTSYYESYINETKPYHTKVRTFQSDYSVNELSSVYPTDFDMPSYYNTSTKKFSTVSFGSPLLLTQPYKNWYENYTFTVSNVIVYDGGSGYRTAPEVKIVAAQGDPGYGATAKAYIALGQVTEIIVTDPGQGYISTPSIELVGGGKADLIPARAVARIENNKVRNNIIKIKFDRVAGYNEIGDKRTTDTFIADGSIKSYPLTWFPSSIISEFVVKKNGILVLPNTYYLDEYTEEFNGYTKNFATLVLNNTPNAGDIITVSYDKHLDLYHAVDRIRDYYKPTAGMPGNTATMLMSGLEYPGVTIDTLPLRNSAGWDSVGWASSTWDDYDLAEGFYSESGKVISSVVTQNSTSTIFFNQFENPEVVKIKVGATATILDSTLKSVTVLESTNRVGSSFSKETSWMLVIDRNLNSVTGQTVEWFNPNPTEFTLPSAPPVNTAVNVYLTTSTNSGQIITRRLDDPNFGTTGTIKNVYATTSTFIGDGYTRTIDIGVLTDSTAILDFRYADSDGAVTPSDLDIDSFIEGGSWYPTNYNTGELTSSDGLTNINVDGDGFVTPDNSYGPEENLPGRVSDTLGISVYTRPPTASPTVTTRRYLVDGSVLTFDIGVRPASTQSVQVLLGDQEIYQGIDFDFDFANSQINLFTVTNATSVSTATGPYFSTNIISPRKEGRIQGTPVGFNQDDDFQGPFPMGFTWNMFGNTFNEVYIGTNGYLTFGGGSALYTPVVVGVLPYPAIYAEYTDLWQGYGPSGQPLSSGETPGIFYATGTVGKFKYFRMRFQGSHYIERNQTPVIPTYDYECTLYSDGVNQYVETIYEIIPDEVRGLGANDIGAVFGIADAGTVAQPGQGVVLSPQSVKDNTSHVFYSTQNGGNWQYAGQGSFDPFKEQRGFTNISATNTDVLSITTMGVGGVGLIESASIKVNLGFASLSNFGLSSPFDDVKGSYVTVNGNKVTNYTIIEDDSNEIGRCAIQFDADLDVGDVVQVWLFNVGYKSFNEVHEQVFENISGTATSFELTEQPPGVTAPYHNQAIVTFNGRRLLPPDIVYYVATKGLKTYPATRGVTYPSMDSTELQVFVNGVKRLQGKDYLFKEDSLTVTFKKGKIVDGDAIAIVILKDHEYEINDNILSIMPSVEFTGNDTIRVTTYTNHDGLSMRRERFDGTPHGRYVLSRQALNSNYVWVEVNGNPIISETDYKLDNDRQTVRLSQRLTADDSVVITSIESGSHDLIGFRMFYDNFGRTHYKRLSGLDSTELIADLSPDDDSITVLDADSLTPPNIERRIPGVVLINGERIEFYQMIGNRLTQLKRGTLGTGIKDLHPAGTLVVDQGINQTIRIKDTIEIEKLSTESPKSVITVYDISTTSTTVTLQETVLTTTTTITSVITSSTIASGNSIRYKISPDVDTGNVLFFDNASMPPESAFNRAPAMTLSDIGWLVLSEKSFGGTPAGNKQWFDNLRASVLNATSGTTYLDIVTPSGHATYRVGDVYRGDLLANRQYVFSEDIVVDTVTKTTSTAWYIGMSYDSGSGPININEVATINWHQQTPFQLVNVPHVTVETTIVDYQTTRQISTVTSVQIESTGTIFELTDITFKGSEVDVSRQVDVFYQGRALKNSLYAIEKHLTNIAYDSGETNSLGVSSTEVLPNEYVIRQLDDRYFLEVFIDIVPGTELKVVKKYTDVWYDMTSDKSIVDQNTEQVRFLRSSPARLPDKYLYGKNTDSLPILVTEIGDTLDSESGDPLLGE